MPCGSRLSGSSNPVPGARGGARQKHRHRNATTRESLKTLQLTRTAVRRKSRMNPLTRILLLNPSLNR